MPPASDTSAAAATRMPTTTILARLAQDRASRLLFAVLAVVAFTLYGSVLPAEQAGGHLGPANIALLSPPLLAFALMLALGLAVVLTLQTYAVRQAAAARRAAGGRTALGAGGFLVSLVPSLCCSPVLPAVLAIFGIGASGATATMQAIAPYKYAILTAILVLFALTGWWTLRRLAAASPASCDSGDCSSPST